ncbi:tetratricopeptide repeat protein [Myxococcus sp. CA056]|uniref:tetratricopeptide repeat protein n=1 Tax=Myxococcus sp. CA056 TaxID=2741740 RepID=UPI00157B8B0E|nr:tetratricopeptide repeat protein [Myxococcus sp. CA056]NTX11597.1 tetratricopeptide repeat protein [Myxococcus sp. CA056]
MSRLLDEEGLPPGMLAPLDEDPGPARRLSRQKSAALVQAAVLAALDAPSPPPRSRRRHEWLMGGALLVVGAAAVATWHMSRRSDSLAPVETSVVAVPAVVEPVRPEPVVPAVDSERAEVAGVMRTGAEAGGDVERAEVAGVGVTRTGVEVGVARAEPDVAGVGMKQTTTGGTEVGVPRTTPDVAVPSPSAKLRGTEMLPSAPAPEDLLRRANGHRATGQWKAAEALYLRVIRTDPQGMSAYVARVASGSLRLEHLGDARGALRQYQEAQRGWPGGVLEEEASHGVTEALRALGDRDGEARALESFLARHPDSPHGVAARARLREISGR